MLLGVPLKILFDSIDPNRTGSVLLPVIMGIRAHPISFASRPLETRMCGNRVECRPRCPLCVQNQNERTPFEAGSRELNLGAARLG